MIDHLVYATPDLAATVDALGRRFGVPPSPGGRHVGLGTANFLADLGAGTYLEVVGPDPEQPEPRRPRPFVTNNGASWTTRNDTAKARRSRSPSTAAR